MIIYRDIIDDQKRQELVHSVEYQNARRGQYFFWRGWWHTPPKNKIEEVLELLWKDKIDVDLYEPTLDSLKFFFPRLINGGVIICDDYNSKVFNGAKKACDEYFKDKDFSFSFQPATGSFFVIK